MTQDAAPIITIPHSVHLSEHGQFCYVPQIDLKFLKIMAVLYPTFANYTKAGNGYSAFGWNDDTSDWDFIGSFGGMTLQSIRKNPLLERGDDRFLRALLGGAALAGYEKHTSVCSSKNYGTLSLWKKMGLGAKLDKNGKARSTQGSLAAVGFLNELRHQAKDDYMEHRVLAERKIAQMDIASHLPTIKSMTSTRIENLERCDVALK